MGEMGDKKQQIASVPIATDKKSTIRVPETGEKAFM